MEINIGGIVGIVRMEQPYGLVDFAQRTGRGGRQEVVESLVVMHRRKVMVKKQAS
jgi:hypothetical protein